MNPSDSRPVILVICDYYLPGFESGGAMRTLVNMVERLSDRFDFRIVTRDHDGPLNWTPYSTVRIGDWNLVEKAKVYYLSGGDVRIRRVRELIEEVKPAAVYLNSFFSPLTVSVLVLKRLGRIDKIPIILAPEGELSPGALTVKRLKKQLYLLSAKLLTLLASVVWKAASEPEVSDIRREFGSKVDVWIAPNMPPRANSEADGRAKPPKKAGAAKLVFLSRFMRKKNFNWLAPHLAEVKGELSIDIWGPLEEPEYWEECREIIANLPKNIEIVAHGPVAFEQVHDTLNSYHFFILPTLGENFGHVFVEALAAGCPLVISDRTPWRDLQQKGIGWDLSLDDPGQWIRAINMCVAMDGGEYKNMSAAARKYAVEWLSDPALETSNAAVLIHAVGTPVKR
jgi:glycosyltransferase involved in cell wall biosynthesis